MNLKKSFFFVILFFLSIFLTSCLSNWKIVIKSQDGDVIIDKRIIDEYQFLKESEDNCDGIPLEIILYQNGINTIDTIDVLGHDQKDHTYFWKDIAEETCITKNGGLIIEDEVFRPELVTIALSDYNHLENSLLDIYPTVLSALGIDYAETGYRQPLVDIQTDHIALIFLDGLNYSHFTDAIGNGSLTAFNDAIFNTPALSVYPPRTSTASAAIITGKAPIENGVFKSGIRQTQERTIFDVVVENGFTNISVEGESLPFNLHGSEIKLSGDRDLNGGTDDNVFNNVNSVIDDETPNLLYIHFHGIDDLGHTYGPNSEEVKEKIIEINEYLNAIIERLPEKTLVIAFADHGMHDEISEKGRGNHGNLIDEDMVVFINISMK